MKNLLLAFLLLGLVAVLKAQETLPDDKEQDFSGTWYPKAMVHNGSLPNHMIPSKVFPVKITTLEEGDLETKIIFWKKGQCHDFKFVMKRTDEPLKYTAFHGHKLVYIKELSVKDHYIFYCEDRHHGKSFGMGKLMGKNPDENPEAMEEFKNFVKSKKLKEENIFIPELNEVCVPESPDSD